jgi:hypothetical protein
VGHEDHFINGRPRWEEIGAPDDLQRAAYEKMKLRLLFGIDPYWKYLWPFSRFRATLALPPYSPAPLREPIAD